MPTVAPRLPVAEANRRYSVVVAVTIAVTAGGYDLRAFPNFPRRSSALLPAARFRATCVTDVSML